MDACAFKEQFKYYNALLGPGKASKARSPKKRRAGFPARRIVLVVAREGLEPPTLRV